MRRKRKTTVTYGVRVHKDVKDAFLIICENRDLYASQVIREFIETYVSDYYEETRNVKAEEQSGVSEGSRKPSEECNEIDQARGYAPLREDQIDFERDH